MYNPESWHHMSHDEGTQLVIIHVERHWCPIVLNSVIQNPIKSTLVPWNFA